MSMHDDRYRYLNFNGLHTHACKQKINKLKPIIKTTTIYYYYFSSTFISLKLYNLALMLELMPKTLKLNALKDKSLQASPTKKYWETGNLYFILNIFLT